MLPLEILMRAAEGGEREAELVRADFEQVGLEAWVRSAIERRLDPALSARVVPAGVSAAVFGALEAFYALWGRWCPSEYRRVRREWLVLRSRWRGDAPVDPPPVDAVTSRLLSEGILIVSSSVVPAKACGLDAGPQPLEVAGDSGLARAAPGAAREEDTSGAADGAEAGDGESSRGREVDPGQSPDAGVVRADGGLPLSPIAERFEQALLRGVEAVEEVRAAWLSSSDTWRKWPAFGRRRERSR